MEADCAVGTTPGEEVEVVITKSEDEDTETTQWGKLVAAIRRPGTGFPMRHHREGLLRSHHDSCTGSEVVEWLARNSEVASWDETTQLAQRLVGEAVIVPVKDATAARATFDEAAFYRFAERRQVVVVGGGFAGRKVASKLQSTFKVTLVDIKDHFLCLLSLPACVCDIDHLAKVTAPHSTYLDQCEVVVDEVVGLNTEGNTLQLKSGGALPYDYLVLCTGSRYRIPIQGNDQLLVIDPLCPEALKEHHESLCKAESVAVIGAGPVGIEIAGEIAHYFPEKQLHVIYSGKKMLERCCKGAHKNVKKALTGPNVRFLKDQKVVATDGDKLITDKGESVRADVAYCCVGFVPNTEFLRADCAGMLSERGHIKVNEYLQVEGHPNIFALGDVADVNEEKLAQNAEKHGVVVAKNISAMESGKSLHAYKSATRILIVSLGPKRAMIIRGDKVYIENSLVARFKSMVEYKTMKGY